MDKKKIPYAVRVSAALLAGKTDESFNIIGEALTDIVGKISKISQNYCYIDLPFVNAEKSSGFRTLERMEQIKRAVPYIHISYIFFFLIRRKYIYICYICSVP